MRQGASFFLRKMTNQVQARLKVAGKRPEKGG